MLYQDNINAIFLLILLTETILMVVRRNSIIILILIKIQDVIKLRFLEFTESEQQ